MATGILRIQAFAARQSSPVEGVTVPITGDGFTVTRRFRGAVYHITVDNAAGVQHGIKAVTVDGKAISGNVLPLAAAGTEVTVQVTMG